jgi:hypothetical protein
MYDLDSRLGGADIAITGTTETLALVELYSIRKNGANLLS